MRFVDFTISNFLNKFVVLEFSLVILGLYLFPETIEVIYLVLA